MKLEEKNKKMSKRIEALDLMKCLQPLTQVGIITAGESQTIVREYVAGNEKFLKNICLNPEIPMVYEPVIKKLRQYI